MQILTTKWLSPRDDGENCYMKQKLSVLETCCISSVIMDNYCIVCTFKPSNGSRPEMMVKSAELFKKGEFYVENESSIISALITTTGMLYSHGNVHCMEQFQYPLTMPPSQWRSLSLVLRPELGGLPGGGHGGTCPGPGPAQARPVVQLCSVNRPTHRQVHP